MLLKTFRAGAGAELPGSPARQQLRQTCEASGLVPSRGGSEADETVHSPLRRQQDARFRRWNLMRGFLLTGSVRAPPALAVLRERGVGVITATEARHANIAGAPPMVEQGQRSLGGSRLSHRATMPQRTSRGPALGRPLKPGAVSIAATARRRATHPRRASKTAVHPLWMRLNVPMTINVICGPRRPWNCIEHLSRAK